MPLRFSPIRLRSTARGCVRRSGHYSVAAAPTGKSSTKSSPPFGSDEGANRRCTAARQAITWRRLANPSRPVILPLTPANRPVSRVCDGRGRREGASAAESFAKTDFRHMTDPAEIQAAYALAERLARSMRVRLTRRYRAHRAHGRLDFRRTIHRSIPHGGTPIELLHKHRKDKPLRLVVLLDASGSMSLYAPVFLRFMHGVLDAFLEAEAFVFHTRLTHISPALREKDAQRAVERLSLIATGIGGGTRIGDSLATFNRWHASRVIHSRTAVVIVSDGYDTGDPARLGAEMRLLRRRCRRIVWLNPMLGWQDYSPEARGMQAALPFIDLFAPAHNLESLVALEPYLARL
jgi:uncharacterized protein